MFALNMFNDNFIRGLLLADLVVVLISEWLSVLQKQYQLVKMLTESYMSTSLLDTCTYVHSII